MSQQVKKLRLQKQVAYKYKGHPIYKYSPCNRVMTCATESGAYLVTSVLSLLKREEKRRVKAVSRIFTHNMSRPQPIDLTPRLTEIRRH